jgi:hypothetical protein
VYNGFFPVFLTQAYHQWAKIIIRNTSDIGRKFILLARRNVSHF